MCTIIHKSFCRWIRFPDLNCPRARPAVVSVCGQLYVIGGRNSKKAELFSVERFDPINNRWDILQTGWVHINILSSVMFIYESSVLNIKR